MDISRASIYDYVTINASIRHMYKDNNCEEEAAYMRKRFAKYGDVEDRVNRFKKSKGCGAVLDRTVDRIDNIRFKTCVCSMKHPLTNNLLQINDMLGRGILPFSGALMEQPAQIMELLDIVDNAKTREINLRKAKSNG